MNDNYSPQMSLQKKQIYLWKTLWVSISAVEEGNGIISVEKIIINMLSKQRWDQELTRLLKNIWDGKAQWCKILKMNIWNWQHQFNPRPPLN